MASSDSSRSSRKNALNPIFENARHEKERKRKAKRRRERMRRRYIRHLNSGNENENDDDVRSVATTGMHSLSSQVTAQVTNNNSKSSGGGSGMLLPMRRSVGNGTNDDMSVMTGMSAVTQHVSNIDLAGDGTFDDDDNDCGSSVVTGISAATQQVSNSTGGMSKRVLTTRLSDIGEEIC